MNKIKSVDGIAQPGRPKFIAVAIESLSHAVGKEQQRIAVMQPHLLRSKLRVIEHAERQARELKLSFDAIFDQLIAGVYNMDNLILDH